MYWVSMRMWVFSAGKPEELLVVGDLEVHLHVETLLEPPVEHPGQDVTDVGVTRGAATGVKGPGLALGLPVQDDVQVAVGVEYAPTEHPVVLPRQLYQLVLGRALQPGGSEALYQLVVVDDTADLPRGHPGLLFIVRHGRSVLNAKVG